MNTMVLASHFDKLRHFIWVYEAGSFLAAAKLNHIGQPQLSRSVKALEELLGVSLFQRSVAGVVPSVHAVKLHKSVSEVMQQLATTEAELVQSEQLVLKGEISLGTYSSISRYLLPKFFDFFDVLHPELEIKLEIARSRDIEQAVINSKLDLGIVVGMESPKKVKSQLLYEDDFSFYQASTLKDARREKLILYEAAFTHLPAIMKLVEQCPSKIISVDSFELAYQLVQVGLGVALLPNRVAEQGVTTLSLQKVMYRNLPMSLERHQIYLIHKRDTQEIADFKSSLREFLELYF